MNGTMQWEPGDALVFVQVIAEGSFTGAANILDLPKSTVSRRISRLEAKLGLQLIRRTTRQLTLTAAGQAFYEQAVLAARALQAAEDAATMVIDEPRGKLRVTAPAEIGTGLFGALIGFGRKYPDVHLDVNFTNDYVDLVQSGVDVALRGGQPPKGSLAGRQLVGGDIYMVASPKYLEENGTPKRATDVVKHRSILFPRWTSGSAWALTGKRGPVKVPVNGQLTINNLDGARRAALAHCGLALLPWSHCNKDLEEGRLKRVLPSLTMNSGGVWIVYPRTPFTNAKVRAFVDYMHWAFA
ncbi:MAG: DNA-binding transcriptional LysR family regulator [Planctomycetota bacterium]|jgi:LysR family transcriptional regulator AphB